MQSRYFSTQSVGPLQVIYAWPVTCEEPRPDPLRRHPVVVSPQAHTSGVVDLDLLQGGMQTSPPRWDGAVWSSASGTLVIQTADCMPLVVCDGQKRWVGAVHLSWRNLSAGMLSVFLESCCVKRGEAASDFFLGIGPHLCGNHLWLRAQDVEHWCQRYPELRSQIVIDGPRRSIPWESWVIRMVKKHLGNPTAVSLSSECTLQNALLPSFRRTGRGRPSVWTVVSLTPVWESLFLEAGWQRSEESQRPSQMMCLRDWEARG